jgi:vacuolar-type H+-ATPase subunit I/STV1
VFSTTTIHRREEREDTLDLVELGEVGAFMSHVFKRPREQQLSSPGPEDAECPADLTQTSEADTVDQLIGKASKAIEFLAARCAILEQELAEKSELVAEHERSMNHWQQFAMKLQVQTSTDQDRIAELVARSDAAEARIGSLQAAAAEAGERSAAAHAESAKLHSQVIAAFGRTSAVHSVLQTIPFQDAAE